MKNLNALFIAGLSLLPLSLTLQGMQRHRMHGAGAGHKSIAQQPGGLTILSMLQQKKRSQRPETNDAKQPPLKRSRTTLSLAALNRNIDQQEFQLGAESAAITSESHPLAGSAGSAAGREERKQIIIGSKDDAGAVAVAFSKLRIDVEAMQLFTHITQENLPTYLKSFIQQRGLTITSIRQPFFSHADPYAYIMFEYLSCIKYHPDSTAEQNCTIGFLPLKYQD